MGFGNTTDGGNPLLLLRTEEGERVLPIGIGPVELAAIVARLAGTEFPRPMTHDLLTRIVQETGAAVSRVEITELRDDAFVAAITLATGAREVDVDARPSDAIALALRTDAPIFASDAVIDEASVLIEDIVEDEDAVVDEFRAFLDEIDPSDFAEGSGS
jgi:bifunctional DNase/RNase